MKIRIGKLTDAFLASYTKDGYISFLTKEAAEMQHILFIKGASAGIRTELYKFSAYILADKGCDVELVHQAQNPSLLEGLILPKERVMAVDYREELIGENTEVLDLSRYVNNEIYDIYEAKIRDLEEEIRISAEFLGENCRRFDFKKPPPLVTDEKSRHRLVRKIADNYFFPQKSRPHIRFIGGIGKPNKEECYREILLDIKRKHYLPAVAEAGLVLQELAEQAGRAGYEAVLYFDNWDSKRAELLLVPQLSLAIAAEKQTADFLPCQAGEKNDEDFGDLAPDMKTLLRKMSASQEKLDDIYKDILAEEYLHRAQENMQDILEKYLTAE